MLDGLTPFALVVLEHVPIEPSGLSVHELADGLLARADPASLGRIRRALDAIAGALGGLTIGRGDDRLGHRDVRIYGLRRQDLGRIRRFFRGRGPYA